MPVKSPALSSTNLKPPFSRLVGREYLLKRALEILDNPGVRLLSLTGPGGVGKTRFAEGVGQAALKSFNDGTFLVSLDSGRDANSLISSICRTLGLKETSQKPLLPVLEEYLANKELLLVLDNLEEYPERVQLLAGLLGKAPGLKLIATNRAPLRMARAISLKVPPLEIPGSGSGPAPEKEALLRTPAVALFMERAQAVNPALQLTAENQGYIAEICRRLDGLPLAIELAASRIKTFPPQALLAQLENSLKFQSSGANNLSHFHRTLQGTINWSYSFLNEEEKTLFARLAVFEGGWTPEAAEGICFEPVWAEGSHFMERLADRSLIQMVSGFEETARYIMLPAIRAFAREKLAGGSDQALIKERHAVFYMELAEEAAASPDSPSRYRKLGEDHSNLQAALTWVSQNEKQEFPSSLETLLRFGKGLEPYWEASGSLSEGLNWIGKSLDQANSPEAYLEESPHLLALKAANLNAAARLARDPG